jgi:RNA-directed DNA polymerase
MGPTSLRQGSAREQEKAIGLPPRGAAGGTPGCPIAGGGVAVVGGRESRPQGEGPQERRRRCALGDDTPAEGRWISVPDLQKRLAEKATAAPDHRFGHLYDLLSWEAILDEAATRLLANPGSRTAGLDGLDREKLRERRAYHLALLQQQLRAGTFRPTPVRRVYIPKRNGAQRPLGIPTLYDRWVQMAIKLVLEPIFESDFSNNSHGFRPNRSCHSAIAHTYDLIAAKNKKIYWVIEGDIEGCFDHVHHKKLLSLLRQRVRDQRLLDLIWRFLRAGVMEGELFHATEEGTPQGGVLSPLLANIYLNAFDRWFAERAKLGDAYGRRCNRVAGHANFLMVRYADDFLVFSNGTKAETAAFTAEMAAWFRDELHLTLSEEKTRLTHLTKGVDFLGFTLRKATTPKGGPDTLVCYPSTASVRRAVRRVHDLTGRRTYGHSPEDQIDALNAFLRGWGEYFRHSAAANALSYVGSYTHMRLWGWLVARQGKPKRWRAVRKRYLRGGTWQAGRHRLVVLRTLRVAYPRRVGTRNPFVNGRRVPETRPDDPFRARWTGATSYGPSWTPIAEQVKATTGGRCAICGRAEVEVHHRKPRRNGGGNVATNLVPLCPAHHREAARRNSPASHRLREIRRHSGEPDDPKGSRPVREEAL